VVPSPGGPRPAAHVRRKAADWLKHWFLGTWTALGLVAAWIAAWIALQRTSIGWDLYPFILLNLCLSCLAAVRGIILQISANRGDKVNSVIALHTQDNTDKLALHSDQLLALQKHTEDNTDKLSKLVTSTAPQLLALRGVLASQHDQLLDMQKQQMDMLKSLNVIQAAINDIQARLTSGPNG
jgi:uncharacterized membrane protein